ncbi:hypothetical protein LPJ63_001105 [Coemansia sp. RSA 2711]|nr:hypothetical protein LPJ63_001105 [Coemansia sp. RSA 2711]KAJ2314256.1 hypothetical protein IWW52_004337 [Coemansia sp. RSA 2704]
MEPSIEDLTASLQKHAQIFDGLLRLIPPKLYLPDESEKTSNNRFMKNTKKETSSKQKDADRKARASAKADRLNPDKLKTVPDLQAEKLEQQENEKKNKKDEEAPAANDVNQEQLNMSKMDIDMDGEKETEADVVPMAVPGSIGELRQKLQARIQNLRQKRKAPEDDVSREALLEKRMKRRKSTKEAKAKAKKAGSAGREQVLGSKTPNANGTDEAGGSGSTKDNIYFGRLTTGMIKKKKGMGAKQQLAKVEGKRKELSDLRKEDAAKADMLEEKSKWNKALDLAKGEKVKDDPKLLRKTIRREEQQKKKSGREWTDRKKQVATQIKERVDKREANLKARVEAKKMKKQGKSKKSIQKVLLTAKKGASGKARPGFEGKSARK